MKFLICLLSRSLCHTVDTELHRTASFISELLCLREIIVSLPTTAPSTIKARPTDLSYDDVQCFIEFALAELRTFCTAVCWLLTVSVLNVRFYIINNI